jgi:hypothetical protein
MYFFLLRTPFGILQLLPNHGSFGKLLAEQIVVYQANGKPKKDSTNSSDRLYKLEPLASG